jgi:hypothetical protein
LRIDLDKTFEALRYDKEHAADSHYIGCNILKIYLFYISLGEELVTA